MTAWQYWVPYLPLAGAMMLAVLVREIVFRLLRDRRDLSALRNTVLATLRGPTRLTAALLGAVVALETVYFRHRPLDLLKELASLSFIATILAVGLAAPHRVRGGRRPV